MLLLAYNYLPGPLDLMLRGLVIGQLGKYDHPETIGKAKTLLEGHLCGSDPLSAEIKSVVFLICVANGDEITFNQLMRVSLFYCTVGEPLSKQMTSQGSHTKALFSAII